MNAVVEPQGAVGYEEWTFNFKNDSDTQQEARTQIALPPGAVVSRLTLWINDKPHEAVFGSREKTKSAYKSVVYRQRDRFWLQPSTRSRTFAVFSGAVAWRYDAHPHWHHSPALAR
ncbi:MAG: VIT domain-containing protein [Candidatus Obscuribacterales bacterium]